MSQQAPTARGTLAATPFAHLLIYALDHRLTGTIVFEEPDHAKHAIYLVEGAPAQVRVAGSVALLGDLARERGTLAAADGAGRFGTSRVAMLASSGTARNMATTSPIQIIGLSFQVRGGSNSPTLSYTSSEVGAARGTRCGRRGGGSGGGGGAACVGGKSSSWLIVARACSG